MKKKPNVIIGAIAVLAVVGLVLLYLSTQKKEDTKVNEVPVSAMNFIMNTFVEMKLYGENAQEATQEISKRMTDYENKMSMHIDTSEISKINQNAGKDYVKVSKETFELMKTAKEYSALVQGAFDITIAPITAMWGITSENPRVPAQEEIENVLPLINYEDILIDEEEQAIMLKNEGQSLDLGGVAKGASANIVTDVAAEYGIQSGYVSIGGNMVVIGDKPDGTPYKFGIRDPRGEASEYIGSVSLKDKTMATTGGYERYFEQDGVRYIHVLDPSTGYPAESDLISVSVISEDGSLADFLSTALFIMGKENVLKNMDNEDFEVVAVDEDNNVYISKGISEMFTPHETKTSYKYIFYNELVEKES